MLDVLRFSIAADNRTASAFGKLKGDLSGVRGALVGVEERANRTGRAMRNIGLGLSAGLTGPLALLTRRSIMDFDKQVQAQKSVEQAVISTGGAAGKSADELFKMASGLQAITETGDEDVLSKVTAPLLSFTQVAGKEFERAQMAILDVSKMMGTDLRSTAVQVGKALNDPIKGLGGLSRAGIQFSDQQKAVIKSLVETGQVAQAQGMILSELETQYGGQAAAAAKVGAGPLRQLQNEIGDLREELGREIATFLPGIITEVKSAVVWFGNLDPGVRRNIVVFGGLAAAIGPVVAGLGLMTLGFAALAGSVSALSVALFANPITATIGALAIGASALALHFNSANTETRELAQAAYVMTGATDQATHAMGDEITQAGLLDGALANNAIMSVNAARTKLDEVIARKKNVQAIYEENRALGLEAAGRVGVGAASVRQDQADLMDARLRAGYNVDPYGKLLPPGSSDFFDPRAQADYEGRVTSSGVSDPIFNAEHRDKIATLNAEIRRLEVGLESASDGVVTLGDAIKPISPEVRDSVAELGENYKGAGGSARSAAQGVGDLGNELDKLKPRAEEIDRMFANTFSGILRGSDKASDAVGRLADRLADMALSSAFQGLFGKLGIGTLFAPLTGFSRGGAFAAGSVVPFAAGGVVGSPTLFPMAGGKTGLMGEAGPEAILPLKRGSDGRLGVSAEGGGGAMQVTFAPVIDARGADAGAVARIEATLARAQAEFEAKVIDTVQRARKRRILT